MIKGMHEFMYLLGVDEFWGHFIILLLILLGIIKCLYPWQPKWKSKKTKDKDGNEVTIYYHIDN